MTRPPPPLPRPHRPRSRPETRAADDGVVQGDLSVNLFMILLVVLATLSVVSVLVSRVGLPGRHASEVDRAQPLAIVRSWQPVQPIQTRLLIRGGLVTRMRFDDFALAFARGEPLATEPPGVEGALLLEGEPGPGAVRLLLSLDSDRPPPAAFSAWTVPAAVFAEEEEPGGAEGGGRGEALASGPAAELAQGDGFDLFVAPGDETAAWDIAAWLHAREKRFRFLFLPRKDIFAVERASSNAGFEEIYK